MPTASWSNLQRSSSRIGAAKYSDLPGRWAYRSGGFIVSFDMIKLDVCVMMRADWETLGEPEI